jgi:hypothetical protein
MTYSQIQLLSGLFSFIPYCVVAWVYIELTNGRTTDFWIALGVLGAVRLFFAVIEGLNGVLAWHVYGKRIATRKLVEFLRAHNFPKRKYSHDDFLSYVFRIEDEPEYAIPLKFAAKEIHSALAAWEQMGVLLGMRMHSASEAALEIYSPKDQAPQYGASSA